MTEPREPQTQRLNAGANAVAYGYVVSGGDDEGVSLSPVGLVNLVLRHRWIIVRWAIICGIIAGALTALLRDYHAESSFAPETNAPNASSLMGLAAQFGVNLSSLSGGPSLDFFAALANSRALLTAAATTTYRFPVRRDGVDSLTGTLVELLDAGGSTPAERVQRAVKRLSGDVSVTKDEDAGIVTIEVKSKWPILAEQVDRRLLSLVNDFNTSQRKSQAEAERAFVGGRVDEVHSQLDSAEEAQRRFFEENRTYQNSPRLQVEAARLQRRVDFLQQVYLALAQAYEQARIEEVRNTPLITVIDEPEGSARHTLSIAVTGAIGLVLGALLGLMVGFLRDYVRNQAAARSPAYEEYRSLRRRLSEDFGVVPRRLRALLGQRRAKE